MPALNVTDIANPSDSGACATHLQAIWSVFQFLVINLFAHCLTMRAIAGQSLLDTAYRACLMIIGPVSAGQETFVRLITFWVFLKKSYEIGDTAHRD